MAGRNTDVAKLTVLMITAFIDMVGTLMILPLMPFYAKAFGASGLMVGLLVSSFSIAQLLSAPMWGRFSDRYGRRPALIVGMTASAIAYVVFAYSDSLWLLFLSRLIQGSGGGTVSVIQAYVADAVEPDQRAKGLGWLSAATNAGVALGPVIGSQMLVFGRHGPGLTAATLCVLNIGFAFKYLVESRDMVEAKSSVHVPGRSIKAALRVVTHSSEPAARLIWIYAIGIGAFQGMNAIFALFLAARFGVTSHTIGYFYTYIGVLSMVTRAVILGWALDKFGEARLSRIGQTLLALGLASVPFMHRLGRSGRHRGSPRRIPAGVSRGCLAVLPAGPGGSAASPRHRVHFPVRYRHAVSRDPEHRTRTVHGGTADVRWNCSGTFSDRRWLGVRSVSRVAIPGVVGSCSWHDFARLGHGGVHPAQTRTRGRSGGLIIHRF